MRILLLLCALVLALPAAAQQPNEIVAAEPTAPNLLKAMIRAGALDGTDPAVRADYLLTVECDLWRATQGDEFKQKQLLDAAGKAIAQQQAGWPNAFQLVAPFFLGTYDFTERQFQLTQKSALHNVNSLLLQDGNDQCQAPRKVTRFPMTIAAHLDQPVTVAGIPMDDKMAQALLAGMKAAGNAERQIWGRFSLVVSFMPTLPGGADDRQSRYSFNARLTRLEFFRDQALTQPLWELTR